VFLSGVICVCLRVRVWCVRFMCSVCVGVVFVFCDKLFCLCERFVCFEGVFVCVCLSVFEILLVFLCEGECVFNEMCTCVCVVCCCVFVRYRLCLGVNILCLLCLCLC